VPVHHALLDFFFAIIQILMGESFLISFSLFNREVAEVVVQREKQDTNVEVSEVQVQCRIEEQLTVENLIATLFIKLFYQIVNGQYNKTQS
jgi:hypothetical protein